MQVLCAIFDLKAEFFGQPVPFRTKEDGIRSFCDLLTNKETLLGQHPEDFAIFKIGDFDNLTGKILPCTPVEMFTGLAWMQSKKEE